jgi:GTP-binding protein YchF
MQTGIIGLPQVGKTSLFRILTKARVEARAGAQNQAHVGIARVPDARVVKLAEVFKPKKITYATIEYVDIGGLQKDREKNSASLVPLREADALAHVVRLFQDPAVPREGPIDPLRDIENVEIELILNDMEQLAKRVERLEKDLKKKKDPQLEAELAVVQRCKTALEAETPLRELEFTPTEKKMITGFMLLSQKPMLYVLNLGDEEAGEIDRVVEKYKLEKLTTKPHTGVVPFCGKIEAELAELEDAEAAEMMKEFGLKESGRDRLIQATYKLLGLISFLTCGEPECRAWTIERGMTAPQAAGAIHSDIERGFIKADVVNWENLLAAGSFAAAKEKAQVKLEGKEYVVQDGDVILFRHSG